MGSMLRYYTTAILWVVFFIGLAGCDDSQGDVDKSLQLLQKHLCRDDCYKKVMFGLSILCNVFSYTQMCRIECK